MNTTPTRFVELLACAVALALLFPVPVHAATPVVEPGQCLYLIGAPPGEPAAAEEDHRTGQGVFEGCGKDNPVASAGGLSPGSLQVGIGKSLSKVDENDHCRVFAWASHAFRVASADADSLVGQVRMLGLYNGILDAGPQNWFALDIGVELKVQLVERDPTAGGEEIVAEATVFSKRIPEGLLVLNDTFGRRMDARLVPGRTYEVRLYIEGWVDLGGGFADNPRQEVDFGLHGGSLQPAREARYDRIQVCLEEPDDAQEVLDAIGEVRREVEANGDAIEEVRRGVAANGAGIQANGEAIEELRRLLERHAREQEREHLEWELVNKDCRPGVWLPEAEGGLLEKARELVADRIAAAEGSGAPGVNGPVADRRLAEADARIAAGDYQKACQRLSDALRALTTP